MRRPVPERAVRPATWAMIEVVTIMALVCSNHASMAAGEKPSCGERRTSLSRMKMRSYRLVSDGTSTFFQNRVM